MENLGSLGMDKATNGANCGGSYVEGKCFTARGETAEANQENSFEIAGT